ncbi:hypothetical protein QBC40DRAFT_298812 [Triangularia verruculosa]|uniref:Uncharacterized protein n=1 Tax=Triangularia verruculosa TaxID=2587418 RepID=A0AAN6XC75_9PEZI|nr:hypothetical protein QBC40DRAFT_298812 [Triangularia verruculosa]
MKRKHAEDWRGGGTGTEEAATAAGGGGQQRSGGEESNAGYRRAEDSADDVGGRMLFRRNWLGGSVEVKMAIAGGDEKAGLSKRELYHESRQTWRVGERLTAVKWSRSIWQEVVGTGGTATQCGKPPLAQLRNLWARMPVRAWSSDGWWCTLLKGTGNGTWKALGKAHHLPHRLVARYRKTSSFKDAGSQLEFDALFGQAKFKESRLVKLAQYSKVCGNGSRDHEVLSFQPQPRKQAWNSTVSARGRGAKGRSIDYVKALVRHKSMCGGSQQAAPEPGQGFRVWSVS